MEFKSTGIEGLWTIHPKLFFDSRGYFFESFRKDLAEEVGIMDTFIQDNESKSNRGVLRGLHFQVPPHGQSKLVRVVKGSVIDYAVDLRKNSKTYGKWYSVLLSAENKLMFYLPQGFAHGFLTMEDDTIFQYKCSNYYHKESERAISFFDSQLGISLPEMDIVVSDKDQNAPRLFDIDNPF
jgi:dTDP-4-dehydrorhamnose 3,5-epimerase